MNSEVEIFYSSPSALKYNVETSMSVLNSDEERSHTQITVDGVRITPGHMHFDGAYEGKEFQQKLIIQNCGTHSAFIRLGMPNSMSFELTPFLEGHHLSPGMKIVRNVKYVYRGTIAVHTGFVPIYINEKRTDYHFLVTLSAAVLSLEPQQLDFGRIDAVNVATTRTLHIKNSGSKGTQFAIDLGRNELELIVEPMKGIVPVRMLNIKNIYTFKKKLEAKSRVSLRVELVGSKEGEFTEEFWVKCPSPLRVIVTGVFITPKLLVGRFINSLDFTLVEFEPTYYGSRRTKPLLIKNSSPSHSMFCVVGDVKGSRVPLEEAARLDENFANFHLRPTDGRIAPEKGSIIQITFDPQKHRNEKGYAACFIKVIRLDCRDVYNNEFEELQLNLDDWRSGETTVSAISSASSEKLVIAEDDSHDVCSVAGGDIETTNFTFYQPIGVCLYGLKEEAGVSLRPDMIVLTELTINKVYERELYIKNKSWVLPIKVKYCKTASIDVVPNEIDLVPGGSTEVKIIVKTIQLGNICKRINFDLLVYDYPKDMKILSKVGSTSLKMHVAVKNVIKKPLLEQCLHCHDLPPKLVPEYPFKLTSLEKFKKINNKNYYKEYIRKNREKREAALVPVTAEDYDLTNQKRLLRQDLKCQFAPLRSKIFTYRSEFIPLTPTQLYHIKITPKSIKLKKVAPLTVITDHFFIENQNSFPILILIKPSKPCIFFPKDAREEIASGEKKKISFYFSTNTIGKHYVSLNILINGSNVFEVTAVAQVVSKTLKLESNEIDFSEADGYYTFFNLINTLNAYTNFDWDLPKGCFKIYPSEGRIKSERTLTSVVVYEPSFGQPNITECTLTSESGQKKFVQVSFKRKRPAITFDNSTIDFGEIPLNVPVRRAIIMKNQKDFKTLYDITNDNPIEGISVMPKKGFIAGKDSEVFIVTVHLRAVITFLTDIIFKLDEEIEMKVTIQGVVDFPKHTLSPNILYFRKIAPKSFDTLAFKVKNLSKYESYITFPIDDFPEFTITRHEEKPIPHLKELILQPQEAKILFLHFHPNHVTTYAFHLPYVINGVLGPPTNGSSVKPFLQEAEKKYKNETGVTILSKFPSNLPLIRVNCCAIDKVLRFTNLTIDFVYYSKNHYANVTSQDFEITNVSAKTVKVCIRTDDLCPPFSLTLKSDQEIEYYDVSYLMVLEPREKIVFEATFEPYDFGESCIRLPIFLRHYQDNKIFNYLTLNGIYAKPTIETFQHCFYFEPIPLKVKNYIRFTLEMNNHFENCKVMTETEMNCLCPIFESGRHPKPGKSILSVLLSYESANVSSFDTLLTFYCSCESSCSVRIVGVTEDCLLTTHALSYLIRDEDSQSKKSEATGVYSVHIDALVNKNITTFPYFPEDGGNKYSRYMRRIQKTLEQWIYSQGFYAKRYYKIPEGFTYYTRIVSDQKNKGAYSLNKKSTVNELPLLELVMNLAGPGIKESLSYRDLQSDDQVDVLVYTYKTYKNILEYFKHFDMYLPHVKAKYLLNYDQYCLYEKLQNGNYVPPLNESSYYSYSKQCWIDLIIQFIKSFFFVRMVESAESSDSSLRSSVGRSDRALSLLSDISTDFDPFQSVRFYGAYEKTLTSWLNICYESQRSTLWIGYDIEPLKKEINSFVTDLKDGLVLGAVIAHFCPYLRPLIQQMCTDPQAAEDTFHNICILVKACKMLNFSFKIDIFTFEEATEMEMLLFVTYLYSILPECQPQDTVTINAPLTQTGRVNIELQNLGTSPIFYKVLYFENKDGLFRVIRKNSQTPIRIAPKKKKKVAIEYYAKSVVKAKATILFSGETPGYKYGRNVTIEVEGVPDVTFVCSEIPLTVNLYKPCTVTLDLEAPCKMKAEYSLKVGLEGHDQLYSWEEINKIKISKEVTFDNYKFEFDENGAISLKATVCCKRTGTREFWLYFTNPTVGDWAIKVKLTGKVTSDCYEYIKVNIPDDYNDLTCHCRNKPEVTKYCPKIIKVMLPKQNRLLWNARKKIILQSVAGAELYFWEKRIYSPIGTRILALIFNSETHPLRHNIDSPVEYNVILGKDCPFVTLNTVVIDDGVSEDHFELPIHPITNFADVKTVNIQLRTEAGKKRRYYKLLFKSIQRNHSEIETSKINRSVSIDERK